MIRLFANNTETYRRAVTEMMRRRNGYRRNRARKYYIKSIENDKHIIIQNYYRFQLIVDGQERWSDIVCYDKNANTVTLYDGGSKFKDFEKIDISKMEENAINTMGEKVDTHYDLEKGGIYFKSF